MCTNRSTLAHADVQVTRQEGVTIKTRKAFQVGNVSTPIDLRVLNNSIDNLERAVLERVFYVKINGIHQAPPKPKTNIFEMRLKKFRTLLGEKLITSTRLSRQSFVDGYTGRKKVIYQKAADSLLITTLRKCDSHVKVFVKGTEKTNLSAKPDPVPRVISPRDPRFGVEFGRYTKPIEHMIYDKIGDVFGDSTVSKGFNAQQVGTILKRKWDRFHHPVCVGLDASRFDQHVSQQALKWCHSIYALCYDNDKELARLCGMQLSNTCRGYVQDGKIKYITKGSRMSGDMDTALGNCLLMCAMIYSYAQERGVDIELMNNGDDCVIFMEQSQLKKFHQNLDEWFLDMGFTMKVESETTCFERVEFCQTQPVFDGDNWIMTRNVFMALAKDSICTRPIFNQTTYEQWVGSVGLGGMSLAGGLPVFQAFYQSYVRASRGNNGYLTDLEKESGFHNMTRGMARKAKPVTTAARVSFWKAYGIMPDEQITIEEYFDNFTPSFCEITTTTDSHPAPYDWRLFAGAR